MPREALLPLCLAMRSFASASAATAGAPPGLAICCEQVMKSSSSSKPNGMTLGGAGRWALGGADIVASRVAARRSAVPLGVMYSSGGCEALL